MGMKFSQLTAGSALAGTEILPMVQSSLNYYTTPAAILTYALTRTLNTWTGTQKGAAGFVASGAVGSYGIGRTDAQAELQGTTKGLLSLYYTSSSGEAAVSFGSDTTTVVGQQLSSVFSGFVNSVNTNASFKSFLGIHSVGAGTDNTTFVSFSNNALKLLNTTASAPWTVAPVNNSIQVGTGTTTLAGMQIVAGLVSGFCGIGAQNLTLSSSNYSLLIKNDGNMLLNAVTGAALGVCNNGGQMALFNANGLTLGIDGSNPGVYLEGFEQTAPSAPATNGYRIFAVDSGGGKTVLKVIFASGAAQTLATQP